MTEDIIKVAFSGVMPFLAPIVFIICSTVVTEKLIDLVSKSFTQTGGSGRRSSY